MNNNNATICARLIELEGSASARDEFDAMGAIVMAKQSLHELEAEARNEAAMFGDSWAGSADDIRRAREGVAELVREAAFCRKALGL